MVVQDLDWKHDTRFLAVRFGNVLGEKPYVPPPPLTPEEEAAKAVALRQYFRICFAHPAVGGILMWGFWEGANWIPQSSLYRRDWTATPAAEGAACRADDTDTGCPAGETRYGDARAERREALDERAGLRRAGAGGEPVQVEDVHYSLVLQPGRHRHSIVFSPSVW